MRIHCLENVDKSLMFLNEQRVHLENMGAHDIVDGNPRLTLGLIWTIILRFQVNVSSFNGTKPFGLARNCQCGRKLVLFNTLTPLVPAFFCTFNVIHVVLKSKDLLLFALTRELRTILQ